MILLNLWKYLNKTLKKIQPSLVKLAMTETQVWKKKKNLAHLIKAKVTLCNILTLNKGSERGCEMVVLWETKNRWSNEEKHSGTSVGSITSV